MSGSLKKQKSFSLLSNTGCVFTIYGESIREALMEHLCTQTKLAGHQLSRKEADDPERFIMIASGEFANYFGSFEEAAKTAWDTVSALESSEEFTFKMNDGSRLTRAGKSERHVLMEHLIEKTEEVGRKITFDEANNPSFIVMIKPSEFAFWFQEFDKAAETAWQRIRN